MRASTRRATFRTSSGLIVTLFAVILSIGSAGTAVADSRREEREKLIAEIEADVRATRREIGRSRLGSDVLAAMRTVPRHEFVPAAYRDRAYLNRPLPIGHGQTVSQPYIVAIMTDLLDVDSDDVVLEVGTGSGYQAAVLAEIVDHVHSIEIIEPLAIAAEKRLARLGYDNVSVTHGDGTSGCPTRLPSTRSSSLRQRDASLPRCSASSLPADACSCRSVIHFQSST